MTDSDLIVRDTLLSWAGDMFDLQAIPILALAFKEQGELMQLVLLDSCISPPTQVLRDFLVEALRKLDTGLVVQQVPRHQGVVS